LKIQAAAGDTINGGTAQKIYESDGADAVPCAVTIVAVDATQWVVVSEVGASTWNNNND